MDRSPTPVFLGFPSGTDSKESTCNAGDLGSIPGLGRSPGGGMATHSSTLAWRIPMDRGAWRATVHGVTEIWAERLSTYRIRSEVKLTQSCPTPCDPMHYIVHRILQARMLKWVAFPLSRGISQPRDLNPGLTHCRWILYQLSHKESPRLLERVAYPFFSRLSTYSVMANWQRLKKITILNASEDGVLMIENVIVVFYFIEISLTENVNWYHSSGKQSGNMILEFFTCSYQSYQPISSNLS